jgi:hypothetical protein
MNHIVMFWPGQASLTRYPPYTHPTTDTFITISRRLQKFHRPTNFPLTHSPYSHSLKHTHLLIHVFAHWPIHFNLSPTLALSPAEIFIHSPIHPFATLSHSHTHALLPTRSSIYPTHVFSLLLTHLLSLMFPFPHKSANPQTHWPSHLSFDVQKLKLNCE